MERLCTLNTTNLSNLMIEADASGAKASTKHLKSRLDLEVIQGHTFWDHWKPTRDCVSLSNNVGFTVGNFEIKVWASKISRSPLSSAPLLREPPRIFAQQECVLAVQGHLRLLILVPIEGAYDLLLVRHSNLTLVLSCTVSEILQVLCSPLFHPNFGGVPVAPDADIGVNVSMHLKLFGCEIIFDVFQRVWKTYHRQTDRQTDG